MILGAVLAGGQSRRFGSDKAEAMWKGKSLIDHAIASLATVAASVIVCGRDMADMVSLPDRPGVGLGPLGGLNAALHHAQALEYTRVITVPCDTPLLSPYLLATLIALNDDGFLSGMPVIGSWRSVHAATLDRYLQAAGNRSVRSWAAHIDARPLDLVPPANINQPADLAMLDAR